MRKRWYTIILTLCLGAGLSAQDDVMTLDDFLDIVREHHPVARQANLLIEQADADLLYSRSSFDPVLAADYDQKSFGGTNYWREGRAYLKVPTWYAIDLKAGYERNDGQFLSTDSSLPPRGLWDIGFEITLGKGLFMDERRAAILQAEIAQDASLQEQIILLNDLLYNAGLEYLEWQMLYEFRRVAEEAQVLAEERLAQTIGSFEQGDKPAIDTLESFVSLQSRQQLFLELDLAYNKQKIQLENFLWAEGYIPLETEENTRPEVIRNTLWDFQVDNILITPESFVEQHPKLLTYQYKLAQLDIDRKLIRESFKPQLDVGFSPLVSTSNDSYFETPNLDDFKVNANFKYPLFLRSARAKTSLNRIKQEQSLLDLELSRQKIVTSINKSAIAIANLREQFVLVTESLENYQRLLQAENRKFEIGESSIFLINSREQKFIESQLKQTENQIKLLKNKLKLFYVTASMATL